MKLKDRSFSSQATFYLTAVLLIFYTVGVIGMAYNVELFAKLSPLNLLLTSLICFWMHKPKDGLFYFQIGVVFLAAFLLEYVGVSSGNIFGRYSYGEGLGPKLMNTPIIIGLNWVLVTYASLQLVQTISIQLNIKLNALLGAGLAAVFMVILDLLMEPIAPRLDFWAFENLLVPIQNYTAWFFFGFVFCYWLIKGGMLKNNPMGWRVYLVQYVFFLVLNIIL